MQNSIGRQAERDRKNRAARIRQADRIGRTGQEEKK
jgi:hypothetical protein